MHELPITEDILKIALDHGEKNVASALHMVLDAPGQRFFVDRAGRVARHLTFQPLPRKIFSMDSFLWRVLRSPHSASIVE